MSQENEPNQLSTSQKWHLIAKNLQSWYLSCPNGKNTTNLFLSDPETLLTPERATLSFSDPENERIDQMMEYYRSRKPAGDVLIWYLHDSSPERLNAKFLARGAGFSGSPDRMWCDLPQAWTESTASFAVEGVRIETEPVTISDRSSSKISQYVLTAHKMDDFSPGIGSVTVNVTPDSADGQTKIAGLFDMFVSSEFRNRGIGTMLARTACEFARGWGCQGLHLNASRMGRKMYERVGFAMMGKECVWRIDRRLCRRFYEEDPASKEIVRFLEAICLGEIDVLEGLKEVVGREGMQQPTRNGMTPLELAVCCKQTGSAEWLIREGVQGDVLSFWDMGWKDRAKELIQKQQELVHVREGRSGRMLLDVALQREDHELAALLASAPLPKVAENKNNDVHIGAVEWEKYFDAAGSADSGLEELEGPCQ